MSGSYNTFASAVTWSWIPIILAMFALLSPRRAVIVAFVIGYLFLPDLNWHFQTLPDINKVSLTAVGVILGSLIFDGGRLFVIPACPILDLCCLSLCLSPVITSVVNGLGVMDGFAASATVITRWGLAYWIGRAYFTDWQSARDLAMGIVVGGLAYVPLCWWEIRMSPQLHSQVYGWLFMSFRQDYHLYGFRPNVFLVDGLTVTMFMGTASLLAYWAWMTNSPKKLLGLPMWLVVAVLVVTTIFCKALGGIILMGTGMAALTMVRWPKTKLLALVLIMIPPTYVLVRASGEWTGNRLVELAAKLSEERSRSLEFRLKNENPLMEKALQQPWFGWGGWGRSHVVDLENRDTTIVDGLWINMLGEHGIVGLASMLVMVLGAAFLLWWRVPTRFWTDSACAAPTALAIMITLYMIDGLFNATFSPIASLAVGSVASMSVAARNVFRPQPQRRGPVAQASPSAVVSSISDLPYVRTPVRSNVPG
jgi:hypothetical protein